MTSVNRESLVYSVMQGYQGHLVTKVVKETKEMMDH